jgi:hypothetical protein
MIRTAFTDEVAIARDFVTGDVVRKTDNRDFVLSPYVGRVLYSNLATGKVSVQWPWGEQLESPSELVKDVSEDLVPPTIDQGYSTFEKSKWTVDSKKSKKSKLSSKIVSGHEELTLPIWKQACLHWHLGFNELDAFVELNNRFASEFGSEPVRLTIANVYELGRRVALYWKDSKRRYKVTQKERDGKSVFCPRCKGPLKPRVYRQGKKMLSCKQCGFAIHPKDLIS